MDSSESTKIVYSRIQKLEPELASKIVGFLLFQDNDNRQMIRLAFSPDSVILSITNKVKSELGFITSKQISYHQRALQVQSSNANSIPQDHHHQLPPRMQLFSLPEFPSKICHYYTKGFCKNGINCRFLHGNLTEGLNEHGSLESLEMELTNLLRSRNGFPISISLLPFLYYEKYGKTLHCKAGYTLTKILAQMRINIRLLQRAHGQHSVILAEDLPKYMEYKNEQTELSGGPNVAARQIYLTFPAESKFTEQEVHNHFNGYGPVEDVRLPFQQKRMFGFVTFAFPETVRMILAKGNPHFIYGARVLVKPYRDKPRLAKKNADRKQSVDKRCFRKNVLEEHEVKLETERRRLSEIQLLMVNKQTSKTKKGSVSCSTLSEMDPPAKKELVTKNLISQIANTQTR
ncbi:hypothetical protein V2J09_017010 [Rumex salicifolius]